MERFAHSLLRPCRRSSRAIAALVVLALVGWLGVTAGHVHLPGEVAAHAVGHADAHTHGHGDHDAQGAHDGHDGRDRPAGERTHPCGLCLTLDRGAGPSAPPAVVVAIVSATPDLRAPDAPVASVASAAVYRSRAPPVA